MHNTPVPLSLFPHRRVMDLLRFCRSALHDEELISDAEYAVLADDHDAVARLESYDEAKARLAAAEAAEGRAWTRGVVHVAAVYLDGGREADVLEDAGLYSADDARAAGARSEDVQRILAKNHGVWPSRRAGSPREPA